MQTNDEENDTWLHQSIDDNNNNNNQYDYRNVTLNYSLSTLLLSSSTSTLETEDWGPRRDPLAIVIPITIIYILTFFSGVIGNVSTCIVIARNKSMHTATNYYLFSLAISDLLLLVCGLPPEIYYIWSKYPYIFGEAFCILQGFAAETSANATVLTITAFTVERYVAICHPFLSHTLSKLNRAIKFIIMIWIVAMCLAIPQALAFGVVYQHLSDGRIIEDHCVCMVKRLLIPHAFEISTVVFFVAPMSLITVLYVLIGLQLHKSTVRPSRCNSLKLKRRVCKSSGVHYTKQPTTPTQTLLVLNQEANEKLQNITKEEECRKNFAKNAQATKHVVKMLIAVVVAFFICWAPFHAQRLLAIYGKQTSTVMIRTFQILTYVSGVLYYLSTTVNPLLYHIMSHKFREAFKNTYKQCFRRYPHHLHLHPHHHHHRRHHTPGGRCYSTLSSRSSQVNSHSNTDSYSRQSSLRYLDAEMARLHDSRRPLVVSFRRKKPPPPIQQRTKQLIEFDSELQTALNNLKETTNEAPPQQPPTTTTITTTTTQTNCSFVEVHHLQPTHICPLNVDELQNGRIYTKFEDLERFQQRQIQRNLKKIYKRKTTLRTGSLNDTVADDDDARFLSKSCTMPEIGKQIDRTEQIWEDLDLNNYTNAVPVN